MFTRRILVVDDQEETRRSLVSFLGLCGMEVCGDAENGREALAKVRELQPDLVLLDLVMPEMNGIDAALEIRQIAPATKILLMSLHFSEHFGSAIVNTVDAGAFIDKAFADTQLIPTINLLLST